jgi:hypothetical protein
MARSGEYRGYLVTTRDGCDMDMQSLTENMEFLETIRRHWTHHSVQRPLFSAIRKADPLFSVISFQCDYHETCCLNLTTGCPREIIANIIEQYNI